MTEAPTITVNHTRRPWRSGLHVGAVLAELGHAPEAVATAVNGQFVPRAQRALTPLRPGDALTLFQPITGG
jgi:sulfur carrier protein